MSEYAKVKVSPLSLKSPLNQNLQVFTSQTHFRCFNPNYFLPWPESSLVFVPKRNIFNPNLGRQRKRVQFPVFNQINEWGEQVCSQNRGIKKQKPRSVNTARQEIHSHCWYAQRIQRSRTGTDHKENTQTEYTELSRNRWGWQRREGGCSQRRNTGKHKIKQDVMK